MSHPVIALHDSIEIADHVVFRELDGETVLLNLETGTYFGLDKVGTTVWTLLRDHGSLEIVLERMLATYDAARETIQADLLRLVGELSSQGLARVKHSET